ncbi:MAG: divalent metal cation transporter [Pseudomonadota bacterium]
MVQSTRAGAMYGAALIVVIILFNLFKYPGFRFGLDYAHATGKTLIGGYHELSPWLVIALAVMNIMLVPIGLSAVSVTTAAILSAVTGTGLPLMVLVLIAIAATLLLLLFGGYRWLEWLSKLLLVFLTLATVGAAALALPQVKWGSLFDVNWAIDPMGLLFVVALAGFMPTVMGQSVDVSLWTLKSQEETGSDERLSLQASRKGFLAAYLLTSFLAVCFCVLGAGIMHASGITAESSAAELAAQIIGLYRDTLGPIAASFAGVAALFILATTLAASFDGAARGFGAMVQEYRGDIGGTASRATYALFLIAFGVLSYVFLSLMLQSFTTFIDLVTSIFFVVTPATAVVNHLVITRCKMPAGHRPSVAIRMLSVIGILVMSALAVLFFMLKAMT